MENRENKPYPKRQRVRSTHPALARLSIFKLVSFVHGVGFVNVNPVGPPTRLPQALGTQNHRQWRNQHGYRQTCTRRRPSIPIRKCTRRFLQFPRRRTATRLIACGFAAKDILAIGWAPARLVDWRHRSLVRRPLRGTPHMANLVCAHLARWLLASWGIPYDKGYPRLTFPCPWRDTSNTSCQHVAQPGDDGHRKGRSGNADHGPQSAARAR